METICGPDRWTLEECTSYVDNLRIKDNALDQDGLRAVRQFLLKMVCVMPLPRPWTSARGNDGLVFYNPITKLSMMTPPLHEDLQNVAANCINYLTTLAADRIRLLQALGGSVKADTKRKLSKDDRHHRRLEAKGERWEDLNDMLVLVSEFKLFAIALLPTLSLKMPAQQVMQSHMWTRGECLVYVKSLAWGARPLKPDLQDILTDSLFVVAFFCSWLSTRGEVDNVTFAASIAGDALMHAARICVGFDDLPPIVDARLNWLESLQVDLNKTVEVELAKWDSVQLEGGGSYYFHSETRETTWHAPEDSVMPPYMLKSCVIAKLLTIACRGIAPDMDKVHVSRKDSIDTLSLRTPSHPAIPLAKDLEAFSVVDRKRSSRINSALARSSPKGSGWLVPHDLSSDNSNQATVAGFHGTNVQNRWTKIECRRYVASLNLVALPEGLPLLDALVNALLDCALPNPWVMTRGKSRRLFFWNLKTGESSWRHPLEDILRKLAADHIACLLLPANEIDKRLVEFEKASRDFAIDVVSQWDPALGQDGERFYVNRLTRETRWDNPGISILELTIAVFRGIQTNGSEDCSERVIGERNDEEMIQLAHDNRRIQEDTGAAEVGLEAAWKQEVEQYKEELIIQECVYRRQLDCHEKRSQEQLELLEQSQRDVFERECEENVAEHMKAQYASEHRLELEFLTVAQSRLPQGLCASIESAQCIEREAWEEHQIHEQRQHEHERNCDAQQSSQHEMVQRLLAEALMESQENLEHRIDSMLEVESRLSDELLLYVQAAAAAESAAVEAVAASHSVEDRAQIEHDVHERTQQEHKLLFQRQLDTLEWRREQDEEAMRLRAEGHAESEVTLERCIQSMAECESRLVDEYVKCFERNEDKISRLEFQLDESNMLLELHVRAESEFETAHHEDKLKIEYRHESEVGRLRTDLCQSMQDLCQSYCELSQARGIQNRLLCEGTLTLTQVASLEELVRMEDFRHRKHCELLSDENVLVEGKLVALHREQQLESEHRINALVMDNHVAAEMLADIRRELEDEKLKFQVFSESQLKAKEEEARSREMLECTVDGLWRDVVVSNQRLDEVTIVTRGVELQLADEQCEALMQRTLATNSREELVQLESRYKDAISALGIDRALASEWKEQATGEEELHRRMHGEAMELSRTIGDHAALVRKVDELEVMLMKDRLELHAKAELTETEGSRLLAQEFAIEELVHRLEMSETTLQSTKDLLVSTELASRRRENDLLASEYGAAKEYNTAKDLSFASQERLDALEVSMHAVYSKIKKFENREERQKQRYDQRAQEHFIMRRELEQHVNGLQDQVRSLEVQMAADADTYDLIATGYRSELAFERESNTSTKADLSEAHIELLWLRPLRLKVEAQEFELVNLRKTLDEFEGFRSAEAQLQAAVCRSDRECDLLRAAMDRTRSAEVEILAEKHVAAENWRSLSEESDLKLKRASVEILRLESERKELHVDVASDIMRIDQLTLELRDALRIGAEYRKGTKDVPEVKRLLELEPLASATLHNNLEARERQMLEQNASTHSQCVLTAEQKLRSEASQQLTRFRTNSSNSGAQELLPELGSLVQPSQTLSQRPCSTTATRCAGSAAASSGATGNMAVGTLRPSSAPSVRISAGVCGNLGTLCKLDLEERKGKVEELLRWIVEEEPESQEAIRFKHELRLLSGLQRPSSRSSCKSSQ